MKNSTLILIFLNLFVFSSLGQVSIDLTVEPEVEICRNSVNMIVNITNSSGSSIVVDSIRVTLPTGITYIPSSLSTLNGTTISETNINNLAQISLSGASVSNLDSLKFEISYTGDVAAIDYQDLGNVFKNTVDVFYNSSSTASEQSNGYNILYPVLSIINVTPNSQTFISGLSTTRTITIVNAGFGSVDQIYLTDVRNSNTLQLDGVDIGTISGDSILLSGTDFSGIGNGNNVFETNESIVITETLSGTACSDITITSTLKAHWGCDGALKTSSTSFSNITIDFQSPQIALSSSSELTSCFQNDVASEQTLTLTNNGSGLADNVTVDIYKSSGGSYDQTIFSRFDENSVYYTIGPGGSPIYPSVTSYSTTNTGSYAVLGANAKGRFEFTIDSIPPGESIIVHWNTYSQISGTCQDEKYMGWKADVTYVDVCGGGGYSVSKNGQSTNGQSMSIFTEAPPEIQNGVSEEFLYIISSFENTLPSDLGVSGNYKCEFTIDAGLQYESLSFKHNADEWSASSISVVGNTVTAYFTDPAPFSLPKSELKLTLSGNCGTAGNQSIELNISYIPDTTCTPQFSIPLICNLTTITRLHCPLVSCDGFHFLSFEANRITYGESDNNLDGNPDASSSLDFTKIKRNRIMVGDTMETVYTIVVDTSTINPSFANLYVEADIELGTNLSFVDGTVNIYDTYSSSYNLCTTLGVDSVDNGDDRKFRFSFVPNTHCPSLPTSGGGFVFKHGDSITFTVKYRVSGNIGSLVQEITIDNDMFSSSFLDPWGADAGSLSSDKWSCDDYDGRITLIGFYWINQSPGNYTVKSCTKYVAQNFGLSIGDCCSNYGGGNLFPYEYRHWGILKEVKMVKPSNYESLTTKLQLYNTKKTNSTIYKNITITPDLISGDTLYYDITQYYDSETIDRSDDGFNGRFKVELTPDCNTPQNVYEEVHWFFNYEESAAITGAETGYTVSSGPDKIRYAPASIEILSSNPIQDANQKDVSWSIGLKNANSSSTSNTWLHINPPANLTITSVTSGGTPLTLAGDLYIVDDISANSTEDLVINGTISNCDTVLIDIYSGFDCVGYAESFATVNCSYDTYQLYVESKRSNYQTRIKALQSGDICDQYVNIEIDISSVEIAHMYDMELKLIVQDTLKIKVIEDSSLFLYPYSSAYTPITTPTFDGSSYNYIINDFVSSFAQDGIPGVLDLSNNRYKLKATLKLQENFIPGDAVQIQINGKNACSEDLKTINLVFDPNSKFTKNEVSGLHIDINDGWTASWGDYDNDGYDDLFIPGHDVNEGNLLYHNDGDGTFTKVTTGDIVTTIGSAVSGTWGDFDNDGDLDLFVAYNANGEDQLFTNNGNGTFGKLTNDPAVQSGLYSHGAAWGDYDNDGYLDLIITDFHLTHNNSLIHNNGDGTFERIDDSPISLETASSLGVNWVDFDGDGDLDVFIANTEHQNNLLYRNDAGIFVKITTGPIVNDGGTSVGGTWGDYDNDGDYDLFVTNSSDQHPNFLYDNNGDGTFVKNTSSVLVQDSSNSHGATWCDYDNDGDLDLMVANNLGANFLYSNNGSGNFTKLANSITNEYNHSYGTAWSDYDNDGDYDLFVANQGSNANDFYTNDKGNCNNYLAIRLSGCHTNTFGIGAKIQMKALIHGSYVWQTREVSSQNNGLGGQNSLKTIIGFGDATTIDSIVVSWPSGVRQVLVNQPVNQEVTFVEDCGAKVCGYVYYDLDQNGSKGPDDIGLAHHLVKIEPYNNFVFTTNADGYFQTYIVDGAYDISYVDNPDWSELNDTIYSLTTDITEGVDYCGNDFGLIPQCFNPDLEVQMSAGAFRRGLRNELVVIVSNRGVADAENTVLTVNLSSNVVLVDDQSTSSSFGAENIYTFDLGSIAPFKDTILSLLDSVSIGTQLGDVVDLTVSVATSSVDCSASNDEVYLQDMVVGSIDPNEKYILNGGGNPFESLFTLGDTLFYKIAFQNVGTHPAQRVVLIDSLSDFLDWRSVRLINSSHPMNFVQEGNVLKWYNENIQLVDSTTNEEESHGYVVFQVSAISQLAPYSLINNVAQIQFDYNAFIVTNNVEATSLPRRWKENAEVVIFPNPTMKTAQVLLIDPVTKNRREISKIEVYNFNGLLVFDDVNLNSTEGTIGNNLAAGVYLVRLYDTFGRSFHTKFSKM